MKLDPVESSLRECFGQIFDHLCDTEKKEFCRFVKEFQEDRYERRCRSICFNLQSEDEVIVNHGESLASHSVGNVTNQQTVEYIDANSGERIDFDTLNDNSIDVDMLPDASLRDFLSRPLRIATQTWAEGTYLDLDFDPWYLYLNDTAVKKKLDNYAFMQASLNVKVMVNASPFYYGAGICSYIPNLQLNAENIPSIVPKTSDGFLCCVSQRPHINIYPQTCEGGEMKLPFFWHRDWVNLNSTQEVKDLGKCRLQSYTPLLNANGVVGANVTVTIYCWLSEVKLSGPTVNLVLQSKDEYNDKGPISKPASALANFASKLKNIPYIGPYARATEMVSSAVGAVAGLFGFTNVPVISDVMPMKSLTFHSFASPEISQPVDKMTLDPKNELNIDSRCVGLDGTDEMLINKIIEKDAYFNSFTWNTGQLTDNNIWQFYVSPSINNSATYSSQPTVIKTPMCHVSNLFGFWRGDIIVKFKIIKSKFHAGRLCMQWDPMGRIDTTNNASNIVYTKIVDISETDEVEFCVPYHQRWGFSRTNTYNNLADWYQQYFGTTPSGSYIPEVHNGRLTVKVLTQLTCPVASADVFILASARAGENMEFSNPIDLPQDAHFYQLQSAEINIGSSGSANLTVYGGEKVVSLRQLLRRSCLTRLDVWSAANASSFSVNTGRHLYAPLYSGFDPSGINSAFGTLVVSQKPYNFVNNTPYTWLAWCYRGYRGSQIWHYNLNSLRQIGHLRAGRNVSGIGGVSSYRYSNNISGGATFSDVARTVNLIPAGAGGQSLTNQNTQAGLSVLYPMYSNVRMRSTDPAKNTLGSDVDSTNTESAFVEFIVQSDTVNNFNRYSMMEFHHSIGTDFSFVFFLNVPVLYRYDVPLPN